MVKETTSEHTPGPWRLDDRISPETLPIVVAGEDYQDIAFVRDGLGGEFLATGQIDANARLIAAAPDLLAAAERIARTFEEWGVEENAFEGCEMIRAAIAKARGAS